MELFDIKRNKEILDGSPSLTKKMLDDMFVPNLSDQDLEDTRPVSSFKQLMCWVQDEFSHYLNHNDNLTNFIHNRICIDENFVLFCQEKKIKIECIYKDSIISWKEHEDSSEKFLVQGVFKISTSYAEFLHAALFHKGCNNEDEISFFILCDSNNFEKYLNIRNDFDVWLQHRDRENNEITVIGGDNIPYTDEFTWDDLYLPDDIKTDIQTTIDAFLSSKKWYLENNLPWKKGMFFYGVPGNGKTSIIKTIISQYNFKPVTICPNGTTDEVEEAFNYAETQSPSLLIFEDLDSMLANRVDGSAFLNFMDGVSTKNGLFVVATANHPERLAKNITDRPSRFDRKFEIPLPDKHLTKKYLNHWFDKKITTKFLNKVSDICVKNEFTYAYLKELYISSMYQAILKNRKKPNQNDINIVLDRIISERLNLDYEDTINVNDYLDNEGS